YVVKMSSSEKRGEVYGIIFSVGPIVSAFSPMFFGYIADLFGLQYVFIIVAFLLISGFVITLLLPKD
ncbi:MAG: MFS transporter, partial [Candidatus Asgardarchaeia archaeon]